MDAIEQTYCRAPLARAFGQVPFGIWISNINISFSKKFGRESAFSAISDYESGFPDGFGIRLGRIIAVECKAAFGKFMISQWSEKQRAWYMRRCRPSRTPYYVAVYLGEDRNKRDGEIYMVPGHAMLEGAYKSVTVKSAHTLWPFYMLARENDGYVIPENLWTP